MDETEICINIECCTRLDIDANRVFDELCDVYAHYFEPAQLYINPGPAEPGYALLLQTV